MMYSLRIPIVTNEDTINRNSCVEFSIIVFMLLMLGSFYYYLGVLTMKL